MNGGVLRGLRIVEMGTFITGPAAGVLLADLGAEVIKVEKPGTGDPFRVDSSDSLYNVNFQSFNRSKRSVALDTSNAADLCLLDGLVADADVFIQNFRPGAAKNLNVDYERLRAINSRLVYCSISGFGPDGPAAMRPCYDTVAQAMSGYLDQTLNPENPRVLGPAVADSITGLYAAYGILGALYERSRTGEGRLVEISMVGAMMHFNVDAFTHYYVEGELMTPYTRPAASQAHVLTCRDGKRIALHLSTPVKFWDNLARAIDCPELTNDPRFGERTARLRYHAELIEVLNGLFKEKDRHEWCRRLESWDVPHAPVYDVSEALADPQAVHLGLLVRTESSQGSAFTTVRSPVVYDRQPATTVTPPPLLDQDRHWVLQRLLQQRRHHDQ